MVHKREKIKLVLKSSLANIFMYKIALSVVLFG